MKILNLYCGIGGNRKLWGNEHEITAIEINPQIAKIYQDFFPKDKVIVGDAHQYLLEHFSEFDFIWSSPPCPTHSRIRKNISVPRGQAKPSFPSMILYEEILFLQGYFKGKWVVENVISWYKPLIQPQKIDRHFYWANFKIPNISLGGDNIRMGKIKDWENRFGLSLDGYKGITKKLLLRNCVNPLMGQHILTNSYPIGYNQATEDIKEGYRDGIKG